MTRFTKIAAAETLTAQIWAALCEGDDVRLDREDGSVTTLRVIRTRTLTWVSIDSTLPGLRGNDGDWNTRVLEAVEAVAMASFYDTYSDYPE